MTCIKICTFRGEVFFDEICKNTFRGVMFSRRHIFEDSYGGPRKVRVVVVEVVVGVNKYLGRQ